MTSLVRQIDAALQLLGWSPLTDFGEISLCSLREEWVADMTANLSWPRDAQISRWCSSATRGVGKEAGTTIYVLANLKDPHMVFLASLTHLGPSKFSSEHAVLHANYPNWEWLLNHTAAQ
jgi:hypothetical protein